MEDSKDKIVLSRAEATKLFKLTYTLEHLSRLHQELEISGIDTIEQLMNRINVIKSEIADFLAYH